jgi:hypothetical protein
VLQSVLQTAAHEPNTREKLRTIVERSLRYVWKIEPLASMAEDDLAAAVALNLQRYIEGELAERAT